MSRDFLRNPEGKNVQTVACSLHLNLACVGLSLLQPRRKKNGCREPGKLEGTVGDYLAPPTSGPHWDCHCLGPFKLRLGTLAMGVQSK